MENEHDEQMWFMLQLHCLDISWLLSFGRKQDKKEKAKDDDHILAILLLHVAVNKFFEGVRHATGEALL